MPEEDTVDSPPDPEGTRGASRRSFLQYVGFGALSVPACAGTGSALGPLRRPEPTAGAWVEADGTPAWTPVAFPVPLAADGGSGDTDAVRLSKFVVQDTLVLPDNFEFQVLTQWGDPLGPDPSGGRGFELGYNCDYTGLIPVEGTRDEYWLIVNHEYVSGAPWWQGHSVGIKGRLPELELRKAPPGDTQGKGSFLRVGSSRFAGTKVELKDVDASTRRDITQICNAGLQDVGVSILHVRRLPDFSFEVIKGSPHHKRVNGFTRPVATLGNCSGATTPWRTFLTCEENIQSFVDVRVTPSGGLMADASPSFGGLLTDSAVGLPLLLFGLGECSDPVLDGRDFGWVCEISPETGVMEKLPQLGRFRHENVGLRADKGQRLAAYMGDDRRGGHLWKFVSRERVAEPEDPETRRLLRDGTLYVARLQADFTGQWIPLRPDTPLRVPEPEQTATGHMFVPKRPEGGLVAIGAPGEKHAEITTAAWMKEVSEFAGKPYALMTLGDLVRAADGGPPTEAEALSVILADAFVMANCVGATPASRPEDIEVHPLDGSVYVAFTDSTGGADGGVDKRVFPDSQGQNSRQYGSIFRLEEVGSDPSETAFTWGTFLGSGEAFEGGGGFVHADNMVFDPQGNLWMTTDISTKAHNFPVDRKDGKTKPGGSFFPGAFGNNALFMIPTAGPNAGVPYCFALGPVESEITGPTFTEDGKTLIFSVQHPGELNGTRGFAAADLPTEETRTMKIATRDGEWFDQTRVVPIGSNFPSGKLGEVPRPCVVCIRRK